MMTQGTKEREEAVADTPLWKTEYRVSIQWISKHHLAEVATIEGLSFGDAWSAAHVRKLLDQPSKVGLVAIRAHRVAGYAIYRYDQRFGAKSIDLLRLAVHPRCRCHGIGRALVQELQSRLKDQRPTLSIAVREENLGGQKFLRALKIPARMVIPAYYEDTVSDAYWFEYRRPLSTGAAGASS